MIYDNCFIQIRKKIMEGLFLVCILVFTSFQEAATERYLLLDSRIIAAPENLRLELGIADADLLHIASGGIGGAEGLVLSASVATKMRLKRRSK